MPKGLVGWLIFAAFIFAVWFVWKNFVQTKVK